MIREASWPTTRSRPDVPRRLSMPKGRASRDRPEHLPAQSYAAASQSFKHSISMLSERCPVTPESALNRRLLASWCRGSAPRSSRASTLALTKRRMRMRVGSIGPPLGSGIPDPSVPAIRSWLATHAPAERPREGATVAGTIEACQADAVFTMLANDEAVEAVTLCAIVESHQPSDPHFCRALSASICPKWLADAHQSRSRVISQRRSRSFESGRENTVIAAGAPDALKDEPTRSARARPTLATGPATPISSSSAPTSCLRRCSNRSEKRSR